MLHKKHTLDTFTSKTPASALVEQARLKNDKKISKDRKRKQLHALHSQNINPHKNTTNKVI